MIMSWRMRWAGHVAPIGRRGMRIEYLGGGEIRMKETVMKNKTKWLDNIKMDFRDIGSDGMDWIDLAQNRDQWRALVNTVMNLRVP
jgi:hypothetical protein